MNAYAERFVKSLKEECLDRLIFFGEASLRQAIKEFVEHYHIERNHQGLGNRLIAPARRRSRPSAVVHRRARLGGVARGGRVHTRPPRLRSFVNVVSAVSRSLRGITPRGSAAP